MYQQYFGLSESPFSIAPDPRYLFLSNKHREALAHLIYGVGDQGGFVLLTGEVGTGKTTIIAEVVSGMEVVEALQEGAVIVRVEFEDGQP